MFHSLQGQTSCQAACQKAWKALPNDVDEAREVSRGALSRNLSSYALSQLLQVEGSGKVFSSLAKVRKKVRPKAAAGWKGKGYMSSLEYGEVTEEGRQGHTATGTTVVIKY